MSESPPYPLQLEQLVFTRSSVIAIPKHEPGPEPVMAPPENKLAVRPDPAQAHRFIATMSTVMNQEMNPASPYFIDMECVSIFVSNGSLSPEEELRGITINAHSVCYGAIREAVSWLTARQPYGPFTLGLSVLKASAPSNPPDGKQ